MSGSRRTDEAGSARGSDPADHPVTMALVGGLPGSGKTTLAAMLARQLSWTVVHSDDVRRSIVGAHPSSGASEWVSTRFSPHTTEATYREMIRRGGTALARGTSVVLDGTWGSAPMRELAHQIAADSGATVISLHCAAGGGVAEGRVRERIAAGATIAAEAVAISRRLAASFEPWPAAQVINTGRPPTETLSSAMAAVAAGRAAHVRNAGAPQRRACHDRATMR